MDRDTRRHGALVAYRAASDLVGKGAFFAVTILAARLLTPAAFGLFALATTLGWLAAVCADFGIQLHLTRTVTQQPARARQLLVSWLQLRALTAALSVVTVAAGAWLFGMRGEPLLILTLFAGGYAMNALAEFLFYYFRALDRSDIESTIVVGNRLGFLVLASAGLLWRPSLLVLAMALFTCAAAALCASLRYALRHGLERRRAPALDAGDQYRGTGGDSWRDVVPIGTGILLSALYFRIDVFLLERFAGLQVVGEYNAVFRLVEALRLLPAAVLAVAMPRLFRAASRRPLAQLCLWLGGGATAVSLALWPAAGWIVPTVYGQRFSSAIPLLRILLLSFPLLSVNYALTHQLIGWHLHRAYAVICAAALAGNLLLNLRWIPAAGGAGAAWATLATEAIVLAGCLAVLAAARSSGARLTTAVTNEVPA